MYLLLVVVSIGPFALEVDMPYQLAHHLGVHHLLVKTLDYDIKALITDLDASGKYNRRDSYWMNRTAELYIYTRREVKMIPRLMNTINHIPFVSHRPFFVARA